MTDWVVAYCARDSRLALVLEWYCGGGTGLSFAPDALPEPSPSTALPFFVFRPCGPYCDLSTWSIIALANSSCDLQKFQSVWCPSFAEHCSKEIWKKSRCGSGWEKCRRHWPVCSGCNTTEVHGNFHCTQEKRIELRA
jgi:hypothetical protein